MVNRSIGLHVFLFVGASVLGLKAWTGEDEPNKKHVAAELWSGRVSDLQRIEFRTDKKLVVLEPKEDEAGRYYVGSVETIEPPPKPPATGAEGETAPASASPPGSDPHAAPPGDPHAEPSDGHGHGAPGEEGAAAAPANTRFVSLTKAGELAESLASLKASRVLGKIAPERLAEFGFDKVDTGTLKVVVAGKEHALALGEKTPGGSDRYVRNPETGEAYVIAGTIANDLTSADNRLVEREFHDFGEEKVAKVVLKSGGNTREIVRHAEEKDFWARPDSPDTKDETVSNWMTKVERLRVTTYVEALEPAPKPEDQVVQVEFFGDRGRKLGFLELVRRPAADSKERPEYVARSERTRWHATVLRSTAEQIDQDLSSVMAP
jgi:hypothetical protein